MTASLQRQLIFIFLHVPPNRFQKICFDPNERRWRLTCEVFRLYWRSEPCHLINVMLVNYGNEKDYIPTVW